MNPEFSGRPFAVGSLFGVRSFRVTREGVLTGVSAREAWKPGINEAICSKPGMGFAASMAALRQAASSSMMSLWDLQNAMHALSGRVNLTKRPKPKPAPPLAPVVELEPHQAGTLSCTCGFYAYFDEGHNPHHYEGNVIGIVEGFGVCTTGTRGFRSSKARLRALIADRPFPLYPDVPIYPTLKAALAEFPLTPVEGAVNPERVVPAWGGRTVTYTMNVDMTGVSKAFTDLLRGFDPPKPKDERSQWERVMQARRERNTGPVRDVRLDRETR